MISDELRTKIRRLFYGEHWTIGTIASQLDLHRDTVDKALEWERFASRGAVRPSALDPFRELMRQTLDLYPTLTGTRVHQMLKARGYNGQPAQVRRYIHKHELRPKPRAVPYMKCTTLPGEQAQADWAHLGTLMVEGSERRLSAFIMVLSHSRAMSVTFSFDQTVASVVRGHVEAFSYFGGVPRTILYDNMKTVVLERVGEAIRFHPTILELQSHYLFAAHPCFPYRPNEKGKVERAIRYLRSSFLSGRHYSEMAELREQLSQWRDQIAHSRRCPGEQNQTVAQAFEHEREFLLTLPSHPFDAADNRAVVARKQPYIVFDTNNYSIPHQYLGKSLTLSATETDVRVFSKTECVASHRRCWGRHKVINIAEHVDALAAEKRRGKSALTRTRLLSEVPQTAALLQMLAVQHEVLGGHVQKMLTLLERYGAQVLQAAVSIALERGTPRAQSLAWIIETKLKVGRGATPLANLGRPEVDQLHVTQHNLEDYDDL